MGYNKFVVYGAVLLLFSMCTKCAILDLYVEKTSNCVSQLLPSLDYSEFLKKIGDFPHWTHEEVPCYGRCLVYGRELFNIDTNSWNKQHIVDVLGADVYNYCRYELDRNYNNACEYAYKGLRCLQQAQLNINTTKSVILECVSDLNITMEQLLQYIKFGQTEANPCLFRCFAEKMNLYTTAYNRNVSNWIRAFGPVRYGDYDFTVCPLNVQQTQNHKNICDWMYKDYVCLERYLYNTEGLYPIPTKLN